MIIVRLLFLVFIGAMVGYIVYVATILNAANPEQLSNAPTETVSISIQCPGSHPVCSAGQFIMLALVIVLPLYVILIISMAMPWDLFARHNHFAVVHDQREAKKILTVPSFKGKALSTSMLPIAGEIDGVRFHFFMRAYKEGGVLRWRERKMDSLMRLELPSNLPHIIVNARENEKARRSNMTSRMENAIKFQFEGISGAHYDAYTENGNQTAALQVFTPDVLDVLYEKFPLAGVEVYGSYLWIVQRYMVVDDKTAQRLFEGAFAFYKKIIPQLSVMNNHGGLGVNVAKTA